MKGGRRGRGAADDDRGGLLCEWEVEEKGNYRNIRREGEAELLTEEGRPHLTVTVVSCVFCVVFTLLFMLTACSVCREEAFHKDANLLSHIALTPSQDHSS